ncbi:MAG: hypothetical protein ACK4J0_00940 [Candidatus Anstonellaceae archaeon]
MEKNKMIIALLIVVVIFALALYIENTSVDLSTFTTNLYKSKKSAIIMDIRESPVQKTSTSIMQCGINLISGGFFAKTSKELVVYACDKNGCIFTDLKEQNQTQQEKGNNSAIAFDEMLARIGGSPYIHIKYGKEQKFVTHPNYLEIFINESTDPTNCQIFLKTQ